MRSLLTTFLVILSLPLFADQFLIPDAGKSQELFWSDLYPKESWTLYCGEFFDSRKRVNIEHIYPVSDIAKFKKCGSIEACRATNAQFNRIEADLHNLYPALDHIIQAREDLKYGLISGEFREFFECDFEVDLRDKIAEPRRIARGNIARSMLYMYTEYNLPIDLDTMRMFIDWNKMDPPSKDEYRRNDIIEKLQGTRNVYIDNPELVDKVLPVIANHDLDHEVRPAPAKREELDRLVIESF